MDDCLHSGLDYRKCGRYCTVEVPVKACWNNFALADAMQSLFTMSHEVMRTAEWWHGLIGKNAQPGREQPISTQSGRKFSEYYFDFYLLLLFCQSLPNILLKYYICLTIVYEFWLYCS